MKKNILLLIGMVALVSGGSLSHALAGQASETRPAATSELQVDLNTATRAELTELPGIGKVMAGRIVAYRKENGPFQKIGELMNVKGVGEKTFSRLRPYLRLQSKAAGKKK